MYISATVRKPTICENKKNGTTTFRAFLFFLFRIHTRIYICSGSLTAMHDQFLSNNGRTDAAHPVLPGFMHRGSRQTVRKARTAKNGFINYR